MTLWTGKKLLDCLDHLELRGRLGSFLEELYSGVECEIRVSEVLSDPFEVMTGPETRVCNFTVALSLYINGMVENMREAKVSVRCGEEQVPALLFADDRHMVI